MEITAERIAQHLKGEIIGDPNVKVRMVAKIEHGKPNEVCILHNEKYSKYLLTSNAGIVIVSRHLVPEQKVKPTLIVMEDAHPAFAMLLDLLNTIKKSRKKGHSFWSYRASSSKIGKGVWIGRYSHVGKRSVVGNNCQIYPQVYIGEDVVLGENCILYPGVKIYDGCKIGNNCILHANVVIGSDGFGFAPDENNVYKKIPQTGNVILEDDVEIGANTVIDRAAMESTIIRKGVKLDNLIQIAHNVEVGENTVMAAQCGVAGSTKIGKWCMFGGQVGMAGHISIADHTNVGAQAGITNTIKKADAPIIGSPAIDAKTYMKAYAVYRRLPEIYQQLNTMKRDIEELKEK